LKTNPIVFWIFLFFVELSFGQSGTDKGLLFGQLSLDSTWNKTIYLSHIPAFKKMYSMSRSMIIAESEIDSLGNFEINLDFLPQDDHLYRLHVSKKNSAIASIIIGGKEENHFFLTANQNSVIEIESNSHTFSDITILQSSTNKVVKKIDDIVKLIDSTTYYSPKVKSDFVEKAFNEQLRHIADTCSSPLVALYALERSKYESNISENLDFYQHFNDKWKQESSPYFNTLRSKIPKSKNKISTIFIYALGILLAFGFGYILSRKIRPIPKQEKLLQTLSIQERKIFELLKQGRSNKEISEELNVGVSTVKSHVSSVYAKLNIKSRKEVLNL
jgi:DNA-binding CsgD family transcriptional regulator